MQTHFLRVFVASLKIDSIYAFYLESFCDKYLAIRQFFAFFYSGFVPDQTIFSLDRIQPDCKCNKKERVKFSLSCFSPALIDLWRNMESEGYQQHYFNIYKLFIKYQTFIEHQWKIDLDTYFVQSHLFVTPSLWTANIKMVILSLSRPKSLL